MTSSGEATLFWILGPLAVLGALCLVFAKKAVYAALGMVMTMIILGVIYIAQNQDFLGIIQIFVYTGAVMMVFLFVLMLVGVDSADGLVETLKGQRWATAVLAVGLGAVLTGTLGSVLWFRPVGIERINESVGNLSELANLIFGRYVFVFEATAALLITASMAAMILAHRDRMGQGPSQREWSMRRFRTGEHPAGLPAPGVYARSNADDTPAMLPDGTLSPLSVSRALRARDQIDEAAPFFQPDLHLSEDVEEGSPR